MMLSCICGGVLEALALLAMFVGAAISYVTLQVCAICGRKKSECSHGAITMEEIEIYEEMLEQMKESILSEEIADYNALDDAIYNLVTTYGSEDWVEKSIVEGLEGDDETWQIMQFWFKISQETLDSQ